MKRFATILLTVLISIIGAKTVAASTYYYSWKKITGTYTFPSVTLNADYTSVRYTINACDGTTISISGSGYTTASYARSVYITIDGNTMQTISLPKTQATVSINYSYRFTDSNSHEIIVKTSDYGGYDRVTLGTVTVTHPVSTASDLNVTLDAAGDLKYYVTESNKYHIKNMTISGPINGEDMVIIREMSSSEKAELTNLNIKDAQMVSGGGSCGTHYYEWSGSYGDYDDPTSTFTADGVINNGLFYMCDNLVDVILPESVTEIMYRAFYRCNNLKTVMIGDSTTKIGNQAFAYCNNLTTIRIPSIVTSIDDYAFYHCSSLTTISLPTSLKTIGTSAFAGTSLSTLTLPAGVENIYEYAFEGTNITTVSFPSSLKRIYGFSNCKQLKTVTFQEGCRPSISPFEYCDNIEKTQVASVEDLCNFSFTGKHNLFAKGLYVNGTKITSLIIPEGTESIRPYAFCNCPQLTSVSFPSTIKSVQSGAFDGCTNISRVNAASLSAWCQINFQSSTEYEVVHDSDGLIAWDSNGDDDWEITISHIVFKSNPLYYAHQLFVDNNEITQLTIPADVTTIGTGAFAYCHSLTSVEFPATVTHVKKFAFVGCNNIALVSGADKNSWNSIQFDPINIEYGVDLGEKNYDGYYYYNELYTKDYSSNPIYASCTSSITDFSSINWSSTDATIASVNEEGVVTAESVGTTMIIANSPGNRTFCTFVVNGDVCLASEILLSESSWEMYVGQEKQLSATVLPESATNKAVRWSSDNTSVATVDNNGLVSAIGIGSAVITASSTDGSNLLATCDVTVTENDIPQPVEITDVSNMDNAIYIEPFKARIGGDVNIEICLKNAEEATAYVFDMVLPEGVTVAINDKGKYIDALSDRHDDHTRTFNYKGDNVYSLSTLSGNSEPLTGNDGAIRLLTLTVDESVAEDVYPIIIKNASYSKPSSELVLLPQTTTTITLENYILGDVNGNGGVDIGDAVAIVNYLVGKESSNFVEKAADTNKNGGIDIGDAVAIVNFLVGKTESLSRSAKVLDEKEPQ